MAVAVLGLGLGACSGRILGGLPHLESGVPVSGRSGLVTLTPLEEHWFRDGAHEMAAGYDLVLARDTRDALLSIGVYRRGRYDARPRGSYRVFDPDEGSGEVPELGAFAAKVGASSYEGACGRIRFSLVRACDFVIEVRQSDLLVVFDGFTSALTRRGRAIRVEELGALVESVALEKEPPR